MGGAGVGAVDAVHGRGGPILPLSENGDPFSPCRLGGARNEGRQLFHVLPVAAVVLERERQHQRLDAGPRTPGRSPPARSSDSSPPRTHRRTNRNPPAPRPCAWRSARGLASPMVTFLSCTIRPTLVSLLAPSAAMRSRSAAPSFFPAAVTTWEGRVSRVVARRDGWMGGGEVWGSGASEQTRLGSSTLGPSTLGPNDWVRSWDQAWCTTAAVGRYRTKEALPRGGGVWDKASHDGGVGVVDAA